MNDGGTELRPRARITQKHSSCRTPSNQYMDVYARWCFSAALDVQTGNNSQHVWCYTLEASQERSVRHRLQSTFSPSSLLGYFHVREKQHTAHGPLSASLQSPPLPSPPSSEAAGALGTSHMKDAPHLLVTREIGETEGCCVEGNGFVSRPFLNAFHGVRTWMLMTCVIAAGMQIAPPISESFLSSRRLPHFGASLRSFVGSGIQLTSA